MKKKKRNKKLLIILLIALVSVLSVVFLVKAFYPSIKTYHSDFLKITIDYPAKYELEERFGEIILRNTKGEILIHRVGTNYKDLESFFVNGIEADKIEKKVNKKYIKVNNLDFLEAIVQYPTRPDLDRKAYYFYKDYGVYVISTPIIDLYPDLDRIAESFRYKP